MKNRLNETISRYMDKCKRMKKDLVSSAFTLADCTLKYKGSYYFYQSLAKKGFLHVDHAGKVCWEGNLPSLVDMKRIIRKTNTLSRNAKPRKRKYTKRSEHWKSIGNQLENLKHVTPSKTFAVTLVDTETSPAVDLLLSGIERELKAHRSNGSDATHLKNIARISADLVKIMQ